MTKNYLVQNVSNAETAKPWSVVLVSALKVEKKIEVVAVQLSTSFRKTE